MANVVLQFNQTDRQQPSSKEVYKDVSATGVFVPPPPNPVKEDYMEFLKTEGATADFDLINTEQDPVCIIATALNIDYLTAQEKYERWKGKSKFNIGKLVNVNAVQNSLHQIFTWIPGERIINPEFGSKIRKYLYEGITNQNIEAITAEIHHCVSEWEPRVVIDRIVNVRDIEDTENNTVRLDIHYHIKGLNNEQFLYSYNYYKQPV